MQLGTSHIVSLALSLSINNDNKSIYLPDWIELMLDLNESMHARHSEQLLAHSKDSRDAS